MLKKLLFYGESKTEKMLNIMFFVSIFIAIGSLVVGWAILKIPFKFYSVVLFNFGIAAVLLYLRVLFLEDSPRYKELREELEKHDVGRKVIDEYIKNLKEWEVFKAWLQFIVGMLIIVAFVFWLIP